MEARTKLVILLLTLSTCSGYVFAQDAGIKAVFLRNNDVFMVNADGQPHQLTFDGTPKEFPTWSKDGLEIAFLREVSQTTALDDLVAIDADTGKTRLEVNICPTNSGEVCSVRYIESIEWLNADKIAVAGSINPTTTQTYVYDLKTGNQLGDYIDDNGGGVFSPDGEHIATEIGSPHFDPQSEKAPELDIDYKRVYPFGDNGLDIVSRIAWSEDSTEVAAVVENYGTKQLSVVVCTVKADCQTTALQQGKDIDLNSHFLAQWSGGHVFVYYPAVQLPHRSHLLMAWALLPGDSQASTSDQTPFPIWTPYDTAAYREEMVQKLGGDTARNLQKQVQAQKGTEIDFWCKNCGFAKLPRRSFPE